MHLRETECECMGLIQLAWGRIHGRPFVNMMKSPQLPKYEFLAHLSHSHCVKNKFTPWTLCMLCGL
jgi:hypothetical protein